MPKTKKANLSVDELIADGWIKTDDVMFPIEKSIPNRNPLNDSEDTDLKLVLHNFFGQTFAILLPDGGMLNFVANSMKELKEFENKINFYDAPF